MVERKSKKKKKLKIYFEGLFTVIILATYSIEKKMVMTHSP
jgi:hypothetical protein